MAIPDHSFKQYDSLINWPNQENTSINILLNEYIIKQVFSRHIDHELSLYDIGFGIGSLFMMMETNLPNRFKNILLEGCEPSSRNYQHLTTRSFNRENLSVKTSDKPFLLTDIQGLFDFVSAIYVFSHMDTYQMNDVVAKIRSILKKSGQFIMAVGNEDFLNEKLAHQPDKLIKTNTITYDGKTYREIFHYSYIPKIGSIVDCNREENYYLDLFAKHEFKLDTRALINDCGFICTLLVFSK